MKKNIIFSIICLFAFCILPNKALAVEGSGYLDGNPNLKIGDTTNLTLGFNASDNVADVLYQISVTGDIELVNVEMLNGTTGGCEGLSCAQSMENGLHSGSAWANIVIKASANSQGGTEGTVTISGVGISLVNSDYTVPVSNISKTITVLAKEEPTTPDSTTTETTKQTTTKKVVTTTKKMTTTTFAKSSDALLRDLIINGAKNFDFNRNNFEYIIYMPENTLSLEMKAIPKYDQAMVEIKGNENFEVGENNVEILVTAEDGTEQLYKIKVMVGEEKKDNEVKPEEDKKEEVKDKDYETVNKEQKKDNKKLIWVIIICSCTLGVVFEIVYLIINKRNKEF